MKNKEEHNKQFAANQQQPVSAANPPQNQINAQPAYPQATSTQYPAAVIPNAAHTNFDYGEDDGGYSNHNQQQIGSRIQKYPLPAFDATSAHY